MLLQRLRFAVVVNAVNIFIGQGGRHVDYVTDQIISKLLDVVKRKEKKAGVAIKPFQVTDALHVSCMCGFVGK